MKANRQLLDVDVHVTLELIKKMNDSIDNNWNLAAEVQSAVQQAEQTLTSAQKEQISHRNNKVKGPYYEWSELQGEGTSNPKEKQIDPWEWGNVHISDSKANVNAQWAALESYRLAAPEKPKEKHEASQHHGTSKPYGKHHKNDLPAESCLIAQMPSKSYIGVALKNIGRHSRTQELPDDPSSESSSSSSSEPSDLSSDSDSDSSSEVSNIRSHQHASKHPRSHSHCSKNKRYQKSKSWCSRHSKAIKPNEYDGAADACAYHQFIKESSAYLEDSSISQKWQCFALSYFLTDKAYDFYQQNISMMEEKWTLEEFYTELFNFCFPIDYWMQMWKKLNHTFQKEKSVNQYAFELEEIFNMIGGYSQWDKVIKLWNGFRHSIQAALYNDKLNPEISSWRKVLAAAEVIEIAEKINGPSKEGKTDSYSGSVVPSNKGKKHHEKSKKNSKETFQGSSNNHASGSCLTPLPVRKNSSHWFSSRDNCSHSSQG